MFTSSFPVAVPLYTIKCYGDFYYRIIKRLTNPTPRLKKPEEFQTYDNKLSSALSRARSSIREYSLCNRWQYFFTFTIDGKRWARYGEAALRIFLHNLLEWFHSLRKSKYPHLRYLLVPEQHEDGAWHFHGLISGIKGFPFPPGAPRKLIEKGYLNWPDFQQRYGWCSLGSLKDPIAVSHYVSLYITESTVELASLKGLHTYYHSRGLLRSLPVGYVYHESLSLDSLCSSGNMFYSTGYFKASDIGQVVDMCDEVTEFYQSHVLSEPETDAVVGIVEGDETDVFFQISLEMFLDQGVIAVDPGLLDLCSGSGG